MSCQIFIKSPNRITLFGLLSPIKNGLGNVSAENPWESRKPNSMHPQIL
jgi:hypothetical protein